MTSVVAGVSAFLRQRAPMTREQPTGIELSMLPSGRVGNLLSRDGINRIAELATTAALTWPT